MHAALLALAAPITVYSLGLGKMTVKSALDQPFAAEIELVDIGRVSLKEIKVSVADPENFAEIGLERAAVLSLLTFTLAKNEQGKEIIKVQSTERIPEPYMELVVDLTWPDGQLYKAYSILLDPPGYHLISTTIQGSPTHYVHHSQPTDEPGVINKTIVTSISPNPIQTSESRKQSTYGPVVANESVWQIAQRYKTSDTILPQVVLAIVGANPTAFTDGNLNGLKVGERLIIPSSDIIKQVPVDFATSEAMAHDKAWTEKGPIDHVLTPPYTSGQIVEKNSSNPTQTTADLSTSSTTDTSSAPSSIPQLITNGIQLNNQPFIQKTTPQSVEASSAKAEVSIAAAAIESVKEVNALLMEQIRVLQKQNDKLQQQIKLRNKELAQLRNQIHILIKQQTSVASQSASYSDNLMSILTYMVLLLLAGGGAGYAYWYLKLRTLKEAPIDTIDNNPPKPVLEPASFILPKVDEDAKKVNLNIEASTNNETVVANQPENNYVDAPAEKEVRTKDIKEVSSEIPEEQEQQYQESTIQSIEDKGLEFTPVKESNEQVELETKLSDTQQATDSLEFTSQESMQFSSGLNPQTTIYEDKIPPKNESVESSQEEYLEFESGLHKPVSSTKEDVILNKTNEEPSKDGIDFVLSQPKSSVEKNLSNEEEEVSLEVNEELQDFFIEKNALIDTLNSTQEETVPELLKSEKALDTLLALARTYISMDDLAAARSSLNEIVEHGSPEQKSEALSLLESIKNK